jgi:hypothetical protein
MWTKSLPLAALGLIAALFAASPAFAQAPRTWVSGVGDDANPCSHTAPCKTWAGAIAKTTAGGEIDALDPGGFGAVTITKALTLDGGGGQVASVLVSGTNGIVVGAGTSDVVILRNLRINGINTGLNGILYLSGAQLNVENCEIFGFTQSGISASTSAVSELYVTNTFITSSQNGISLTTTKSLFGAIDHSYILNVTNNGVAATGGNVNLTISNSVVDSAVNAVLAGSAATRINVDSSSLDDNNAAFNASVSGAIIRVSNNTLYANTLNSRLQPEPRSPPAATTKWLSPPRPLPMRPSPSNRILPGLAPAAIALLVSFAIARTHPTTASVSTTRSRSS